MSPRYRADLDGAVCASIGVQELWFPEGRARPHVATEGQTLCATCPLLLACYLGAVERGEEYGTWGGVLFGPRARGTQQRRLAELAERRPITADDLLASIPTRTARTAAERATWNDPEPDQPTENDEQEWREAA